MNHYFFKSKLITHLMSFSFISSTLIGITAQAQEENSTEGGVTERPLSEVTKGVFQSPLTISGNLGMIGFQDGSNQYTSRDLAGVTLAYKIPESLVHFPGINLGAETGFLYSHIGAVGSDFFGKNSTETTGTGSNSFLLPLNVIAGINVTDRVQVAGHVGTDLIYRSVSNTITLGRGSDSSTGSSGEFFPAVGINAGWAVSKSMALTLRTDYIFTPATDIFTASLGATFPLA